MGERDVYRAKEAMESVMKKGPKRLALIIGAILLFLLILHPWVQIGAGERGTVPILSGTLFAMFST